MSRVVDEELLAKMRKRLGHRIKVRRVDMEMQQGELAEAIDMKQPQLSQIERGIRSLRVEQLMMIAKVLRCPVSHLLDEDTKSVA